MTTASLAAFDKLAPSYDASFTTSIIGAILRQTVHRRLETLFNVGDHILDLGCGTGEDAVFLAQRGIHVAAVDASARMVEKARQKCDTFGLHEKLTIEQCRIEEWPLSTSSHSGASYDGVLSNFGALNCVDDLGIIATRLAKAIKPGGRLILVVMGPFVPWEWLWYLAHAQPGKAFRRLERGGISWRGLTVRYPGPTALKRNFAPSFDVQRLAPLGFLVPPSYVEEWAQRHPRFVQRLAHWERRLEHVSLLGWLSDHYILELERRAE